MSVASQIDALAGAIRDKFNAIRPRLIPAGGAKGHVMMKNSNADYDTYWSPSFDHRGSISGYSDFIIRGATQDIFAITAVSSGTFATAPASGVIDGNHPGVILLRGSTTSGGGVRVQTEIDSFRLTGGEVFEAVFRLPASLVTTATYRLGFHDATTSADAVDGAYFEIVGGTVTGKIAANSVRTASATIATLAAGTWYHARVTIPLAGGQAIFEIFSDAGALVGTQTVTGTLPTAAGRECGAGVIATNASITAADLLNLDYIRVDSWRTLQRGA